MSDSDEKTFVKVTSFSLNPIPVIFFLAITSLLMMEFVQSMQTATIIKIVLSISFVFLFFRSYQAKWVRIIYLLIAFALIMSI